MAATDSYPENLTNTISTIKNSLPIITALPSIDSIIQSQAEVSTHMASHLESLASHYDQMAGALRESEAGEVFSEEDLQGRFDSLWAIEWIVKLFFYVARYES
jgi:autophagy-related protein 17